MKQEIRSFNPNFFTNHIVYSCFQKKRTPAIIKKKGKVSNMNLEDRVDNYLRLYIQKDIPITREQADEINEYKCELRNRINKAIEVLALCDSKCSKEVIEILKGKSE